MGYVTWAETSLVSVIELPREQHGPHPVPSTTSHDSWMVLQGGASLT